MICVTEDVKGASCQGRTPLVLQRTRTHNIFGPVGDVQEPFLVNVSHVATGEIESVGQGVRFDT